jgi:hypothetical protein
MIQIIGNIPKIIPIRAELIARKGGILQINVAIIKADNKEAKAEI